MGTGFPKCVFVLQGHEKNILSIAVSADGRYILSGSDDHTAKLWDSKSGKCIHTFAGHKSPVRTVSFSPKGLFALTGAGDYEKSKDNTIKLWELESGKELLTFVGHEKYVSSVCFSPDGLYILSGSNDGKARLWEVSSGALVTEFKSHEGGVWAVAYSPDGKQIFMAGANKLIRQYDIDTGRCIRTFFGHKRDVSCISLSRDGKYLLSGSWDFTLKFWCLGTRAPAHSWYPRTIVADKALEQQRIYEAAYEKARKALDTEDIQTAITHVKAARDIRAFERNPEIIELCRRIGKKAYIKGYRGAWLHMMIADTRMQSYVLPYRLMESSPSGSKDKPFAFGNLRQGSV